MTALGLGLKCGPFCKDGAARSGRRYAVCLTSRLEQAGKQYGAGILASEYTLNSENADENGKVRTVGDMTTIRFIDCIIVVGRSEPVKVYEVRAEWEPEGDVNGLYCSYTSNFLVVSLSRCPMMRARLR